MDQNLILQRFEQAFTAMKKELGFKSTLEEIDGIFFVKDFILHEGHVSPTLNRALCSRMCNLFFSWSNYLHDLVMPHPGSIISNNESGYFSDEDKQQAMQLMSKIMAHTRINQLLGLTKNKKEEALFIDESVRFWKEDLEPVLIKYTKHSLDKWKEQSQQKVQAKERNNRFE